MASSRANFARWVGGSTPSSCRITSGKEKRYPLYSILSGPQGRCGRVRKISLPPRFDPGTESIYRLRYPGPRFVRNGLHLFEVSFLRSHFHLLLREVEATVRRFSSVEKQRGSCISMISDLAPESSRHVGSAKYVQTFDPCR